MNKRFSIPFVACNVAKKIRVTKKNAQQKLDCIFGLNNWNIRLNRLRNH